VLVSPSLATAQAPAPTHEQYIAQADSICKAAFRKRLPRGHGSRLHKLARPFAAISRLIGGMADKLDRLVEPPDDAHRLTRWLRALHQFSKGAAGVSRGARHENEAQVRHALGVLNRAQKHRLAASRGYGFHSCA
jgi:hypothetical protein